MNTPTRTVTGLYFNESERLLFVKREDGSAHSGFWEPPTFDVQGKHPDEDALVDGFWRLFDVDPIGCDRADYSEETVDERPIENTIFVVGTIVMKSVLNDTAKYKSQQHGQIQNRCIPRQLHLNHDPVYTDFDFVDPYAARAAGFSLTAIGHRVIKKIIDGNIPLRQYS